MELATQGCALFSEAAHFPFLEALSELERSEIFNDVSAGVTIAVMVVPQGLAYAGLAGLSPVVGIYSATVPAVVYAMLGGSRQSAIGPMSVPCLLIGSMIGEIATTDDAEKLGLVMSLTLWVGLIMVVLGICRAGALVSL